MLFSTGVMTGWQLSRAILMGLYGAPISPVEYVALCGAFVLLASAGIALYFPRGFVWPACVGLALLWGFYFPALVRTMGKRGWMDFRFLGQRYGAVALLAVATGYLIIKLSRWGYSAGMWPNQSPDPALASSTPGAGHQSRHR